MRHRQPNARRALVAAFAGIVAATFSARAAEASALPVVDGWWQETGSDGIVYYLCASAACGESSMISFKAQKIRTPVSLQEFESRYRKFAERSKGSAGVREIKVTDPKERSIEGVQVLQISREMTWADGTTQFIIEARLFGGGRSFSIISGSQTPELSVSNFEKFLPRLAVLVAADGKQTGAATGR